MNTTHYKHWPAGLPYTLTAPVTSVYTNLEISARRYPNKAAIIFYDAILTYAEFNAQVDALAGFLQQRCGVKRGDRVLLFMQNSPQFIIAYYAILRADAMVVPVNPMNLTEELRHHVADSGAAVALTGQELYPQIKPLLTRGGLQHVVVAAYSDYTTTPADLAAGGRRAAPAADRRCRRNVMERCVAGGVDTSRFGRRAGRSVRNAVHLRHDRPAEGLRAHARHVMSTAVGGLQWFGSSGTAETISLGTLPLFHVTGMQSNMNQAILAATVVLLTRWDRDLAARLIERYRVTNWINIATMAIDFLAKPELGDYDLSSLRRIGGGGAAMPEAVAQRLKKSAVSTTSKATACPKRSAALTSTRSSGPRSNASASRSVRHRFPRDRPSDSGRARTESNR